MANDALMKLMEALSPTQDINSASAVEPATIKFSWLAKLRADAFLETVSIAHLRTEFKKNRTIHTEPLALELIAGVYNLNIDLIGKVYNAVKKGHPADVHPFGMYIKDPLTTLNLNAAYEIATRCIGISYAPRITSMDIKHTLTVDNFADGKVISIADILAGANIVTNNKTIILLTLPLINHHRTHEQRMPLDLYRKALEIYTLRCGNYAERIIFTKALSFVTDHPALNLAVIAFVQTDDIKFKVENFFSGFSTSFNRNKVFEQAFEHDQLETIFKNHVRRQEQASDDDLVSVAKPSLLASLLLGTIDWVWRLRFRWNHNHAVGKGLTLIYTDIFKADKRKMDVGFTYINNRYILETLGQSFIGFETNSFDSKCNMFRSQARNLLSIHDPANIDWETRYTTESLAKLYSAAEDYDEGMIDLRRTLFALDILIKSDQSFNLYHLLTAYIFYAKYILKDYVLDNVVITSNIDIQDILQWLEADV